MELNIQTAELALREASDSIREHGQIIRHIGASRTLHHIVKIYLLNRHIFGLLHDIDAMPE